MVGKELGHSLGKGVFQESIDGILIKTAEGASMKVQLFEKGITRVEVITNESSQLGRTWMITDTDGKVDASGNSSTIIQQRLEKAFIEIEVIQQKNRISLHTSDISCDISLSPLTTLSFKSNESVFHQDLPSLGYVSTPKRGIRHYCTRHRSDKYYGLGEMSGALNLHHRRFTLRCSDSMGYDAEFSDPLYKHCPFFISLIDTGASNASTPNGRYIAYGVLYDNYSEATFDFGRELNNYHGLYRYASFDTTNLDYYLLFGPSIQEVCEKLAFLTGYPMLPPIWTLGYLGSSMIYTDSADPTTALGLFIDDCNRFEIKASGFHLSSGYSALFGDDSKRYVFQWDKTRIPDPKKLTQQFTDAGIHLMANIKPALLQSHALYPQVTQRKLCILNSDGSPCLGDFWGGKACFLDFTKPETREWWKDQVKQHILGNGIEITWNDNNEFEAVEGGLVSNGTASSMRPVLTLLMLQASQEAQREFSPEKRPFVLSRSGGIGLQRYGQTWSGDNFTEWKTMRFNNAMGLNLGLSGIPNNGHDVGGFSGPKPSPELLLRWVQNGIFQPRFTVHSWNEDKSVTELWMYPELLDVIKQALQFRHRLYPYLYSLFHESSITGHPLTRPFVYHFQDISSTHEEFDFFMLGPHLIVPTISEPGDINVELRLPPDVKCFDLFNALHGDVRQDGMLRHSDVLDCSLVKGFNCLIRSDTIFPLSQDYPGTLELHVFVDLFDRKGVKVIKQSVYFDDGASMGYQNEASSEFMATFTMEEDSFHMKFELIHGIEAFAPLHVEWTLYPRQLFKKSQYTGLDVKGQL